MSSILSKLINLAGNITGTLPVANGGTGVTTSTGNTNVVLSNSPTLVTPTLGAASATSINKVAITAPSSSATLTIADGKTLTANNSLTLAGTDSTTMTFPASSATVAGLGIAQTFTAAQVVNVASDVVQMTVKGNGTQTSDLLSVQKSDTTQLLEVTNTAGTKIRGTTTTSTAASGFVGEILTSGAIGAGITVTTSIVNVGSLALSAGNWLVFASLFMNGGASTTVFYNVYLSTTSASSAGTVFGTTFALVNTAAIGVGGSGQLMTTSNSSSTVTYYLNASINSGTQGSGAFVGYITALRIS